MPGRHPTWHMPPMGSLRSALEGPARTRSALPDTIGGHIVVVQSYDALNQTVDVVYKNNIRSQPIRGVKIAWSDQSCLRSARAYKSIEADGEKNASVGYLVYPGDESAGSLIDRLRNKVLGHGRFTSTSPLFIGTLFIGEGPPHVLWDATDTAGTNPAVIGPNDEWVASRWGQVTVFKANGDVVNRYTGNSYFFRNSDAAAVALQAARKGDSGDGGPGVGSIASNSTSSVYLG